MMVRVDGASLFVTHVSDGEEVIRGDEDGQAYVATFSNKIAAAWFIERMRSELVWGERQI